MTARLNRRHLLKGASSLLAVATLGGFASRHAQAAPRRSTGDAALIHHPACTSIDQSFYDARVVNLYGQFERAFYDGLPRA